MAYELQRLLARLSGVRESGGSYTACCPSHDDKTPSLSVKAGEDGRVLVYCHAGCDTGSVVESVGLRMADLFST